MSQRREAAMAAFAKRLAAGVAVSSSLATVHFLWACSHGLTVGL
jgi:hypothetical protein